MVRPAKICGCGEHAWQALTRGHVAIFDPEFSAVFSLWNWFAKADRGNWYAARTHHQKTNAGRRSITIRQHSVVLPISDGFVVDHINGNSLDNRRSNLRISTVSENAANQKTRVGNSQYRGVSRAGARWQARIGCDGAQKYLGNFSNEAEAARAYDQAAVVAFGPFARLNFPVEVAS